MKPAYIKWGVGVLVFLILLLGSLFIVDETNQALVFQFGEIRSIHKEPGLKFKIPLIQEVVFMDKRSIEYEKPAFNITLLDQKRIVVDVYVLYRIEDPLQFYKAVIDEKTARARLDEIVPGTLKAVFGGVDLSHIISESRKETMEKLLVEVNKSAIDLGIHVIDARIRRSDLPPKNSKAIFDRMKSERQHAAREVRAQGDQLARQIRSSAEKERTILVAEAEKQSQLIRGQAEAQAIKIYASVVQQDPEFFEFYRTLEAYGNSLNAESTTFVLAPRSRFFQYFNAGHVKKENLRK